MSRQHKISIKILILDHMASGFRFHLVLHIPTSGRIHPISLEKELIPPPLSHLCRIRPIDTENKLMFARAEEGGKWAKWVKVSGRYRLLVMGGINRGSKRYSVKNIVNYIVIALCGDRW